MILLPPSDNQPPPDKTALAARLRTFFMRDSKIISPPTDDHSGGDGNEAAGSKLPGGAPGAQCAAPASGNSPTQSGAARGVHAAPDLFFCLTGRAPCTAAEHNAFPRGRWTS